MFEPELHLDKHILVPDLAGWRRESLPQFPEGAYISIAPDWACEILSPATARIDRAVKMPIYAEQGVSWLWLVDPDCWTLEVYSLHEGHWLLEHTWQENERVQAPPFIETSLVLSDLWVPKSSGAE
ncbi:conserved hypothetical protein [Candidatus Methylobacter favarea]|uniref:Putative restriction endonuclease domain-containing protein n=1 Tax=Candidatus Methylobacter favarea TaxID=2707345 RepID=A0A8S0W8F6_9GAMM|nr:conserved hypothetical protein [Candidatus Methylobacter favarea]